MQPKYASFFAVPIVLALALSACGTNSKTAVDTVIPTAVTATSVGGAIAADALFNSGDVAFAQGMIPHHQQAVEMADIALDPARTAGAAVKDLATRIQGAQGPEIQLMTGWLTGWGQPIAMAGMDGMGSVSMEGMAPGETKAPGETMPVAETMAAMEGMSGMKGMMSADEMTGLEKVTGAEFDKAWLGMMIRHHDGAVGMSKTEQTDGKNVDAIDLAGKIISAQEAEIEEMKKLLAA